MKHAQVDLTRAERIYAVSNVPLFLLRKLQSDEVSREISTSLSEEQILSELGDSLRTKPRTLREAVEPYVLLVALAKKRNLESLKNASSMRAPYHDWFTYLAHVLVQTFAPTTTTSLIVPGQLQSALPTTKSTAATGRIILTP